MSKKEEKEEGAQIVHKIRAIAIFYILLIGCATPQMLLECPEGANCTVVYEHSERTVMTVEGVD